MLGVDQRHNQHFRLHWADSGKARNPRSKSASSPTPIWKSKATKCSQPARAGALAILHQSPRSTDLDLKGDVHAGIELAKAAVKLHPQLRP